MLISLIGLPGVGKSTVGRRLARALQFEFADCDALLVEHFGRPIADVFELAGEEPFREAESRLLEKLVGAQQRCVIATGGGIVLRPSNRLLLSTKTFCIHLEAKPEALYERLKRNRSRPLLRDDLERKLLELHAHRSPLYVETAAASIDMHGHTPESAVTQIRCILPAADESLTVNP